MDAALVLVITPMAGTLPLRVRLRKRITSIGSDEGADLRLATVAPQWAVVERQGAAVCVRELVSGTEHILEAGGDVAIGSVALALELGDGETDSKAIERLTAALSSVESADEALERILEGVMEASSADTGAIIMIDNGAHRVACARDSAGQVLTSAAELLSDTIVADVLGTGKRVCLTNVAGHDRYANIPSIASMRLRSVICLPLSSDGATLGAIFLGKQDLRSPFRERVAAELRMVTALAVPFLAKLRSSATAFGSDQIVSESEPMKRVAQMISRVGPSDLSVLVSGESGTGKELVARAIHQASPRRASSLVAINCAAVPESLLAGELFGYKKGAFSGAATDRAGLVEAAGGSTLFLDEVGDMPMAMQSALLRVLEQREVTRLGENEPRPVDFRLVCASHRNLDQEVVAGRMREDLVFRLREVTIELPPLRERGHDVLLLANVFLRQAELGLALPMHSFSDDAVAALLAHPFRGNVRELKATVRRAAILAESRTIRASDLGLAAPLQSTLGALGDLGRPLAEARDNFVRRYSAAVLERCDGDREKAAVELGIGVRSLYRYLSDD